MKVLDIVKLLNAEVFSRGDTNREVESVYTGDLLSNVMSRIGKNALWITIMNNVNVAAVASLSDVAVVVLCEGVMPDDVLINKALKEEINLITTQFTAYEAIKKIVQSSDKL